MHLLDDLIYHDKAATELIEEMAVIVSSVSRKDHTLQQSYVGVDDSFHAKDSLLIPTIFK